MSIHSFGRESRKAVEKARGQVAAALNAQPNEIYFTGCGTESRQLGGASGAAYAEQGQGQAHHHLRHRASRHPAHLRSSWKRKALK